MKKSLLIILACFICLPVFGQEKYFHDLRGMEDSSGTTHLFYRIFDSAPAQSDTNTSFQSTESNHIYHFNSKTGNSEFYLADHKKTFPNEGFEYQTIGTFIHPTNNPDSVVTIRGLFGGLYGDYTLGTEFGHEISLGAVTPLGFFYDSDLDAFLVTTPVRDHMIKRKPEPNRLRKTFIYDPKDPIWNDIHSYQEVPDSLLLDFTLVYNAGGGVYIGAKDSALYHTINYGDSLVDYYGNEFYVDESTIIGQNDGNGLYEFKNRYTENIRVLTVQTWNGGKFHVLTDLAEIYNFTAYSSDGNTLYYSKEDSLFKSTISGDYRPGDPKEEVYITHFADSITGLHLKPGSDSLFVLTANELLEFNITEETTTNLLSLPVSNEPEPSNIPSQITLEQNYPNPFNPTTVISYQLTGNSLVRLEVFDVTGRKVATLVNGQRQTAGNHRASFEASGLSSGVYFYRLEAAEQTLTRKMLLVK